jgi:hypothetical protein
MWNPFKRSREDRALIKAVDLLKANEDAMSAMLELAFLEAELKIAAMTPEEKRAFLEKLRGGGNKLMKQFNRGDRVEYVSGYYGIGTIRYLDDDLMPDSSGRRYNWPNQFCVEFDNEIEGKKPFFWCKPEELREASKSL